MAAKKTVPSGTGPFNFAPVGKGIKAATMQPAKLTTLVGKIDTKSIAAASTSLREVKLKPGQVAPVLAHVYKNSPEEALKLSRAVLEHAKSDHGQEDHARALFQWAKNAKERQMVCAAFHEQKLSATAVHQIGELTKKDAHAYMKDYFAAGGTINSVSLWLEAAGAVLKEHEAAKADGTAGNPVKWVGDQLKKVGGKIVDAAKQMI